MEDSFLIVSTIPCGKGLDFSTVKVSFFCPYKISSLSGMKEEGE